MEGLDCKGRYLDFMKHAVFGASPSFWPHTENQVASGATHLFPGQAPARFNKCHILVKYWVMSGIIQWRSSGGGSAGRCMGLLLVANTSLLAAY